MIKTFDELNKPVIVLLIGLLLVIIFITIACSSKNSVNNKKAPAAKPSNIHKYNEVIRVKYEDTFTDIKYRTISKNNAIKVVQVEKNSPVISSAKAIKAAKRLLPDYATIREANLVIITNPNPSGLLWQVVFDSFTGPPESDPFHYASVIYLDPLTGKENKVK